MNKTVLKARISNYYKSACDYQKRRHAEWLENYTLSRNRVQLNRLTQRQNIVVPLTKETQKSIIANIDDAPDIAFEDLSANQEKEIFINEQWNDDFRRNNLEIKDIVDKKQVFCYGRSFKKLNFENGKFIAEIVDVYDLKVDRHTDPSDIETANYLCHDNIFRTLTDIETNKNYDFDVVEEIKAELSTKAGKSYIAETAESMQAKEKRISAMGDENAFDPIVGETYLGICEHYIKLSNENYNPEAVDGTMESFPALIHVVVKIKEKVLMNKTMWELFGVNFFPFESWADDVENTDFWSDACADIVRPANKVLNAWLAQLTENRTLRNFGMSYYNNTNNKYDPNTFEPEPFGHYGVPGNPNELIKRVDVPELKESLTEIQWLMDMAGRATAATAAVKGETESRTVTLGEVKLVYQNAMERITSMQKFYRLSWQRFAEKWWQMMQASANQIIPVKLYKKGISGKYYSKDVSPEDWKSEAGFKVIVTSSTEQEQVSMETIERLHAIVEAMSDNPVVQRIYKKKLLEIGRLSSEEQKEALDFEKQKQLAVNSPQSELAQSMQLATQPVLPSPSSFAGQGNQITNN